MTELEYRQSVTDVANVIWLATGEMSKEQLQTFIADVVKQLERNNNEQLTK